MNTHPILALMSTAELLLIPCALVWLWTLAQCLKRKQYIWFAVVLLTFIIGAVAYWLFGRGTRPAAAQ